MVNDPRKALVIAALAAAPLDRIRLMKALFLSWHRLGRPGDWPFRFEPYFYGPCSFAVYSTLDALVRDGLVLLLPEGDKRGRYFLTQRGQREGNDMAVQLYASNLREIARWAANQTFDSLLSTVYREAPEFAKRSVVARQVLQS